MILPREIFMQCRPAGVVTQQHKFSIRLNLLSANVQNNFNAGMIEVRIIMHDLRAGNGAYQVHGGLARARSVRAPDNIGGVTAGCERVAYSYGRCLAAVIERAFMVGYASIRP